MSGKHLLISVYTAYCKSFTIWNCQVHHFEIDTIFNVLTLPFGFFLIFLLWGSHVAHFSVLLLWELWKATLTKEAVIWFHRSYRLPYWLCQHFEYFLMSSGVFNKSILFGVLMQNFMILSQFEWFFCYPPH